LQPSQFTTRPKRRPTVPQIECWSDRIDRWAYAAHQGLAIAALQEGRFEDACACFSEGVRTRLASTRLLHALATALAGRPDEAKSILRDVHELEPNIGMRLLKEIGVAPPIIEKLAKCARILGLPEE
jgi:tetratricopeptide (TPR) repeat protein